MASSREGQSEFLIGMIYDVWTVPGNAWTYATPNLNSRAADQSDFASSVTFSTAP